jgi:hypothetical protein
MSAIWTLSRLSSARTPRTARTDTAPADVRAYLAELADEGVKTSTRGAQTLGHPPVSRVSLPRGSRADDPTVIIEGPKRAGHCPK